MAKQLLCPDCGSDNINATGLSNLYELSLNSAGDVIGYEEGEVQIDYDSLTCGDCGIELRLECTGEGEEERVYHLEKVRILKVKSE